MLLPTLTGLIVLLTAFLLSALLTSFLVPQIIKVASKFHLTDKPGYRKIHKYETPTLGGIGIFAAFSISYLTTINSYDPDTRFFFAVLLMLFFIGITDDIINIRPVKKLLLEILAAMILIVLAGIRFTTFHGFLGLHIIPLWLSVSVTLFIMIVIINALNLIDGVDGLAASIGILASVVLGFWFWSRGSTGNAIITASLAGTLAVFLVFNMSKGKYKIFMGDSGSLVIGLILSILIIRFNELNAAPETVRPLHSAPAVSIAILIVPLFDTLRVFIIRILYHQSPFKADNRHIHHLMLRAGYSPRESTLYISIAHILIIAVAFLLDNIGIFMLSIVLLLICMGLTGLVHLKVRNNTRRRRLPEDKIEIGKVTNQMHIVHHNEKKSI